ncbi:MAG: DUF4860 domain-containing protein [Eubacterium sp.]|nr:DUF4860 domain-containing protein [Eubacterium sp.]
MKAFVKFLIIVGVPAVIGGGLIFATDKLGLRPAAESAAQVESTVREAVLDCYANEGVYPPSVDYLKDNYGLIVDEKKYGVYYEIFGKDIPPQISVMELDNKKKENSVSTLSAGKNAKSVDGKDIISYIEEKIRTADGAGKVEAGGFAASGDDDGINTLHIYRDVDGDIFDERIYLEDGKVYEMMALKDATVAPEEGTVLATAKELSFIMSDGMIEINVTDSAGKNSHNKLALRGLIGEGAVGEETGEDSENDSGGVG